MIGTLVEAWNNALAVREWVASVPGQLADMIRANHGQNPPSEPNPLVEANDGGNTPSGTAGAVVTPATVVCVPGAGCVVAPPVGSVGALGFAPGNATLNSGNGGGPSTGSNAGDSANSSGPIKNAENLVIDPRK